MAAESDEVALSISESVASDPEVRPAPVRVRVVTPQTSAASVPKAVSVRLEYPHTFAGMAEKPLEITEPMEVEAVRREVFVFAFTTAAIEDEAFVMVEVRLVVAVVRSAFVASEPEVSEAEVSEREPYDQISATVSEPPPTLPIAALMLVASTLPIEPAVFIVLVATFQMLVGSAASDEPSELEAVRTVAFV